MVQCQINICQCLGFNSLGGIHYQNSAVTGCQRTAYLIIKVHMPGGINQVKNIFLPVLRLVNGADCLRLNGNAPLPLQIHIIQHLLLHFSAGQQPRPLYNPVCQGGFTMVYMCYNTKIPNFALLDCHISSKIHQYPAARFPCGMDIVP